MSPGIDDKKCVVGGPSLKQLICWLREVKVETHPRDPKTGKRKSILTEVAYRCTEVALSAEEVASALERHPKAGGASNSPAS